MKIDWIKVKAWLKDFAIGVVMKNNKEYREKIKKMEAEREFEQVKENVLKNQEEKYEKKLMEIRDGLTECEKELVAAGIEIPQHIKLKMNSLTKEN